MENSIKNSGTNSQAIQYKKSIQKDPIDTNKINDELDEIKELIKKSQKDITTKLKTMQINLVSKASKELLIELENKTT